MHRPGCENHRNESNKQRIHCANYMLTNTRTKCQNLIMQNPYTSKSSKSQTDLPDRVGAHLTCRNGSEPENVQSTDLIASQKEQISCIVKCQNWSQILHDIMRTRRESPWVRILQYEIRVWRSQPVKCVVFMNLPRSYDNCTTAISLSGGRWQYIESETIDNMTKQWIKWINTTKIPCTVNSTRLQICLSRNQIMQSWASIHRVRNRWLIIDR